MWPDLIEFPALLVAYRWAGRYHTIGAPDNFAGGFPWITAIEQQMANTKAMNRNQLLEIVQWGGGQRGLVARVLEANPDDEHVQNVTREAFAAGAQANWENAHTQVLLLGAIGATYATKVLRFRFPYEVGAYDTVLHASFKRWRDQEVPRLAGWPQGQIAARARAQTLYRQLRDELNQAGIARPLPGLWRAADIDMCLFSRAMGWA